MNNHITFDPTSLKSMIALMDEHGNSDTLYPGRNEYGERTTLSISHDSITCVTYQENHWVRMNIYWRDGTKEELYDGKW
jgi:hypothetical protein